MCGRYTLTTDLTKVQAQFGAELEDPELPLRWKPRYNAAPTQLLPVITATEPADAEEKRSRPVLRLMRWGLIPHWSKDVSAATHMINARAETVDTKPAYRQAFLKRRCIVPIDGFYEWQATPSGKVPKWIHRPDGAPLAIAGVWESWEPPQSAAPGKRRPPILSFAIITTEANPFMSAIHDRMPVVLADRDVPKWLNPEAHTRESAAPLRALLSPWSGEPLEARTVSKLVNSPSNDLPECLQAASPENEERPAPAQGEFWPAMTSKDKKR